ncbi:NADH-quinone oxidoreductase subunit K [Buchnera aphidicola (Thelaxes suberi)]|uniref:NADH-quinone oxidoreductase subunit NuoK n=1 Tax=Buchnera aphidicola TaxID=9 RepID=UPI003463CDA0
MISLTHGLILSIIIFTLGLISLLIRKSLLFILISLEVMINAIIIAAITISTYFHSIQGQAMYIIIVTIAAIEASIGLTILIRLHRTHRTLNTDSLSENK